MKKILFAVLSLGLMGLVASCGSSKKAQHYNVPYSQPEYPASSKAMSCEDQVFVPNLIRGYGIARSYDKGKAMTDAIKRGQTQIGVNLYRTFSLVDKEFGEDLESNKSIKSMGKRSQTVIGVIDNASIQTTVVCSETTQDEAGVWTYEVCVEMNQSLKDLGTKINNELGKQQELEVRFNEQEFDKVYNSALEEYRKQREKK